jgi:protein-tyrosine phosphatase
LAELQEWTEMGCLMQVTASSFEGRFGREAQTASEKLMEAGLVRVVASDGHDTNHRPPELDLAFRHIAKEYGDDVATLLLVENPRAMLAGAELPARPMLIQKKKKWYQRI